MQFIKDNAKTILLILAVVLTLVGFRVTQGEGGQIIIVPPVETLDPVNVKGTVATTSASSSSQVGMIRIRVRAAKALADQQGWSGPAGFVKADRKSVV